MPKKPQTKQQTEFAEKQNKLAELKKVANAGAALAEKKWHEENPECADLAIRPMNIGYIRSKKPTARILDALVERMLWESNMEKSQAELTQEVSALFPDHDIHPNIWNKELNSTQHKKVTNRVNGMMQKPISIRGCKTLSQVRKKLMAQRDKDAAERIFKTTIAVGPDGIVVGNTRYAIEDRKVRESVYPSVRINVSGKRQWMRVDILVALLSG